MPLSKILSDSLASGVGQGKFESALLHVRDVKTQGTGAGQYATGSFQKHDVNTVVTNEITGASLASSQITLPAGTYYIDCAYNGWGSEEMATRLYNTTDSSVEVLGMNTGQATNSNNTSNHKSHIRGRFTLSGEKVLELQHRQTLASHTQALGLYHNFQEELYLDAQIWKIA